MRAIALPLLPTRRLRPCKNERAQDSTDHLTQQTAAVHLMCRLRFVLTPTVQPQAEAFLATTHI